MPDRRPPEHAPGSADGTLQTDVSLDCSPFRSWYPPPNSRSTGSTRSPKRPDGKLLKQTGVGVCFLSASDPTGFDTRANALSVSSSERTSIHPRNGALSA